MELLTTPLEGVTVIKESRFHDERGSFSRLFCEETLSKSIVQVNHSVNKEAATLRGLHYQLPPFEEVKIVRCIKGALYDVALDLRKLSPTFGKWYGITLTEENGLALVIPEGCAHGFLTLMPHTELLYFVTAPYAPDYERGIRFDDPRFAIEWPIAPRILSEKDLAYA